MPFRGNFIEKHIAAISMTHKCVTLRVVRKTDKFRNTEPCTALKNENNITVEYYVKERTSFLGKLRMKISEWYYYRKGMKTIEKKFSKPALIHLHVALPLGIFAAKWSNKWKVPLVLTEHWSIYNQINRLLLTPVQKRKLKKIFTLLSGVTTVSQELSERIGELFPLKNSKVIYNVVNTELFVSQKSDQSPKKILHISTLNQDAKNFLGILEAISILSVMRQDFVLEVVCEYKNLKAEAFVKEHRLEKFVHFLERMPEEQVAMKMGSCDFFLLFSNYENLPCTILEALSCGKPVLTTPVGGITEIINEERGIFVEPKNVAQLSYKLDYMLQHYQTFNSEHARNFAVNNFSKDVINLKFAEFYSTILNKNHIK